jgi:hypothetical protein
METRDTAALRATFQPGGRLVGIRTRPSGAEVQTVTVDQFVSFLAGDRRERWVERLWDPEVRVDGTVATIWGRYDFHFANQFSHCGTDSFQLLRTAEGWKIVSVADTYVQEGCERRQPPAP